VLLGVATVIVFDHQQGMLALSSGLGRGSGITRFAPLGFHPDLTGYVFGASVWLMARRVLVTTHWLERVLMVGGALAASLFVLAASSRSSLIALFVAGLVAITIEYRLGRLFSKRWVRIGCVLFAIFGAIFYEKIAAYFIKMLDLDSSWRGVNSGGSGRTDLWARGIATFFQDPLVFIFGGGFRSSNAEQIGFSTESSYISILLDSGAFLGVAIILVFWYAPIKALRLTNSADRYASPLVLLAAFMTFIIVESVFNRYLLAIGNPASLMSLLILLSLSMRQNLASSAVPKANNWTAAQPTLK
jgi:exopolysaccharide production protein ExoQ